MLSNNIWVPFREVTIGGQRVATASRAELTRACIEDCKKFRSGRGAGRARIVFDVNGQGLSLSSRDASYRAAMEAADVVHADGGFIVTLSRLFGRNRIAERSATTDLIDDIAEAAAKESMTFYLLGGTREVSEACARKLAAKFPGLRIIGNHHGYFSIEDEHRIIDEISFLRPDILWVGLGKPKEQEFLARNSERINAGWAITCGGCFNFVAGTYTRAPTWMQRLNLEWLYRMACNPKQMAWRYITTNPHALFIALFRTDWRQKASEG